MMMKEPSSQTDTITVSDKPSRVRQVLTQTYLDHSGYTSDKWEQYLPIYDFLIDDLRSRNQPVNLLEIGVQNGGSLQIWSKILPPGSRIFGVDIDPKCAELILPENVTLNIADAGDRDELSKALAGLTFDVIIDDGSHVSSDIIKTFENCFHYLKLGGVYLVEDVHCSYFASHGGGLRNKYAAIEYFKNLIDVVHADYFEAGDVPDERNAPAMALVRDKIAHVTFLDSVIWIQTLAFEKIGPFRRILTGAESPVVSIASYLALLPIPDLRSLMLSGSAFSSLAPLMIAELISTREQRDRSLTEADAANRISIKVEQEISATRNELGFEQQHVVAANQKINQLERELAATRNELGFEQQHVVAANQKINQFERELAATSHQLALGRQKESELELALALHVAKADALLFETQALRQSTSWRMTAPMRRLASLFGRHR